MNELEEYFRNNTDGRVVNKWWHYFDIYDRHFNPYKNKPITVVEFGVYHGGSLRMWKKYFGPQARIIGVDIQAACKELEEKQIEIFIGDQADRKFLRKLRKEIGPIDIVIDDGGHTMEQQTATFEEIWPAVSETGIYLTEDLHTSYWKKYGGGYKQPDTFIEFSKNLIDQLHAWYSREEDKEKLKVDRYTKTIRAIHAYSSIMVFEKGMITKPHDEKRGKPSHIHLVRLTPGADPTIPY